MNLTFGKSQVTKMMWLSWHCLQQGLSRHSKCIFKIVHFLVSLFTFLGRLKRIRTEEVCMYQWPAFLKIRRRCTDRRCYKYKKLPMSSHNVDNHTTVKENNLPPSYPLTRVIHWFKTRIGCSLQNMQPCPTFPWRPHLHCTKLSFCPGVLELNCQSKLPHLTFGSHLFLWPTCGPKIRNSNNIQLVQP